MEHEDEDVAAWPAVRRAPRWPGTWPRPFRRQATRPWWTAPTGGLERATRDALGACDQRLCIDADDSPVGAVRGRGEHVCDVFHAARERRVSWWAERQRNLL